MTKKKKPSAIPYEYASAGGKARDDIIALLRRFGCESVGIMDDFADHSVVLAFKHKGRPVQLRASAKGWAQLYVKNRPPGKKSQRAHTEAALQQGHVAVNSMLRDWVKGQVTAVECGILSFEAVFMPYMLTSDGRPLIERIEEAKLLPPPNSK